jgi:hypothetical protein
VKGAVDNFVGRIECHLDLAGIGIDGKRLMLGSCEWSKEDGEG